MDANRMCVDTICIIYIFRTNTKLNVSLIISSSSNISGGGNLFHWASSIMGYLIRNTLLELSAPERLITVPRIFVAREESFDNVIPVLLASCRPGIMLSRRTIRN